MAARGTIAKEKVVQVIAEAFGSNYLGEFDKKFYVQTEENGEIIQIAIALTCPKNPSAAIPKEEVEEKDAGLYSPIANNSVITKEELENIDKLIKYFDL